MESSIQIEERAAAWLARRDSHNWTAADEEAFTAWLEAATANRVAYLRLEAAWEAAQRLRALGAGVPSGVIPPRADWQQSPFPRQAERGPGGHEPAGRYAVGEDVTNPASPARGSELRFAPQSGETVEEVVRISHPFRAIAASLLFASAVGAGWYLWPVGPSYRTAVGGVAEVPMTDGSKITLNTDSEIRVAVTKTERRVQLEQGEAFFDVAKDPTRPFVVEAGHQRFIAVGTKFSVLRETNANRLVVTEGRVRVETSAGVLEGSSVPPTEVSAGGIARSSDEGVLVQEQALPETEVMLSWRSGYLVFKETPLADAIAEFNRYNEKKIVIEDASVAGIQIGGNFRSTNVEAFVRLLEDGFPIRVDRQDQRIVLSQR